jgi:multidrug efflux pump subunit AcrA (membrane-fusion protein)
LFQEDPVSHGRFLGLAGLVAVFVCGVLLLTWIHLPIRFTRPCRLFPQAEWVLLMAEPDTFKASLLDRRAGSGQQISLFRFARGDVVNFSVAPGLSPGISVPAGQEVARLDSFLNQETLDQLRPQLDEAQAGLRAAETGLKQEAVALTRSELSAAEARSQQMDAELRRAASLWEKGVISAAEHELAVANQQQARAELEAAQNALRAAQAGEKAAIVEAMRARVALLRQQTADAERRIEAERIRCPIDGEVITLQGDTALVRIADLDTLYAVAPVSPSRASKLQRGQAVMVKPLGAPGKSLAGNVVRVDHHATAVAGRSFFWVTVAVPNPEDRAAAGVKGEVRFRGNDVSLLAWLADQVKHAADRTLGV